MLFVIWRDELETFPDCVTCTTRIPRLRLLYKGESRDAEIIESLFTNPSFHNRRVLFG